MYRDDNPYHRAASYPSQRNSPFGDDELSEVEEPKGAKEEVKNDPVGRQAYASNAYGEDIRLNWIDRS